MAGFLRWKEMVYARNNTGLFGGGEGNRVLIVPFWGIDKRRFQMPKYLVRASYTIEGLKGLLKEGGSRRREAVAQAVQGLGGTLEAFYYAFGDTDVFFIVSGMDIVNATAGYLIGSVAGTSKVKTTLLITPEEVDQATDVAKEKIGEYRPPGQ